VQHAVDPRSLVARHHQSYNDRDLDALREVFDEDVEIKVDGATFHGVAAALGHAAALFREFPRLRIHDARVVAESGDTIVVEYQILNGDPSGGPLRPQGSVCEIYRARDGRIVADKVYYMPEGADREDAVNVPSRAEGSKMAEEQAALRRVATLVARGVSQDELFAAVNEEVGWLVGADPTSLMRFEADDTVTLVAAWSGADAPLSIGARRPINDELRSIRDAGGAMRFGPAEVPPDAPFAEEARQLAVRSAVGVPILVDGRVWGVAIAASTRDEPFPEGTTARIAGFTELVATAIANTESRGTAARLTEEQVALRRVATLVARGAPPEDVFAAVTEEVHQQLRGDVTNMCRYEPDGAFTILGSAGSLWPVGSRWPFGGNNVATLVFETARPARIENYAEATGEHVERAREVGTRSAVGTPIIVEGRLWGLMTVGTSRAEPVPADTEARLASFTELVAMAIANAESRAGLARLAEEQAALRRVATLAAEGTSPEELFAAVVEEVGRVFPDAHAGLARYDPGATLTVVAISEGLADGVPVGGPWPLGGKNVSTMVFETGRSTRIDRYGGASGRLGVAMRELGLSSVVGAPIVVDGRLWGVMTLASTDQPLPPDSESHLASFTELVATAIANAEARTEVAASRARIVAATDEERQRVVRDLHDGAQQRLVHTVVTLKLTQQAVHNSQQDVPALVGEALDHAQQAMGELRELAHGILPVALTQGGLRAGVDALASRMPMPIEIDVTVDRLPAAIEATAYFVVAEALTNVAKHAHARHAEVTARIEDGTIEVQVRDDGVGGARPGGGGLVGLADRLAAVDGRLRVDSTADGGTLVAAAIPLPA
jgi:signal transduction histidine kinase/ketosteroid isomerase-like protein